MAADPNLGSEALYRAGGSGPEIALRVLRASPDRLADAFGTTLVQATDILIVAMAVLPVIEPGDSFTLGTDTLMVQQAERDAAGLAWRVLCQR
ncbi:hypothetical protein NON00_23675 [Roseomonas sp. GC11]|uniref:head-tail joining protein n=1 Tax=Roseomonas sp. GC11 TaxID=2950546 RepID=UPI00210EA829|nr:hypothetical protein [Roseomonas sp. GC11]MCQ4162905.1 hypothetical protein [Roseomonas sp. GC11]